MNEHLRMNEHGLRLLIYFEKGPRTVPLSPDGAALEPYVCPGGKLTIGYGCTKWFDGSPVTEAHRLSGEAEARDLLMQQLVEYEEAVRNLVTVELNSNQFSALVAFAFNCGIHALAGSTVLREMNARRWEDAAAAFGMWIFATNGSHKQALRGLLRRRYAEATTAMGYRFEEACDDDAIALQRIIPEGDPPKGSDRVTYKTPFLEVLRVAQHYPLQASPEPVQTVSPVPAVQEPAAPKSSQATTVDSGTDTLVLDKPLSPAGPLATDAKGSQPSPATQPATAGLPPVSNPGASPPGSPGSASLDPTAAQAPKGSAPASPIPRPLPAPSLPGPKPPPLLPSPAQQRDAVNATTSSGIDPSSTKSMLLSRRFWGLVMIISGRVIFALYGTDTILKLGSDPIVSELVANVMVLIASSAWEYCGEVLHTWGRVRARRALR